MKIVGPPVCGCRFVDRPPMSQRSHIAMSGRTAICACSAAMEGPEQDVQREVVGETPGLELVPQRPAW
jgi:hypothetical protein